MLLGFQQNGSKVIFVPVVEEGHDRGCGKARLRDRHNDPEIGADIAAAVHHGRLLHFLWNGEKVAAEDEKRDRDAEAGVDKDHTGQRILESEVGEQPVDREADGN